MESKRLESAIRHRASEDQYTTQIEFLENNISNILTRLVANPPVLMKDLEQLAGKYISSCLPSQTVELSYIYVYDLAELMNVHHDEENILHARSGYLKFAHNPSDGSQYLMNLRTGRIFYFWLGIISETSVHYWRAKPGNQRFVEMLVIDDEIIEEAYVYRWENIYEFWSSDIYSLIYAQR